MLKVTMRVYVLVALKNGRASGYAGFSYTERWSTCQPQVFLPWVSRSSDYCITLTLFSNPEVFSSWSVDQSCHTYDPKHKPSLCFQTTVPTALAYTTYRLRPLEPNLRTVLALSKDIVCAHSNGHMPSNRINLQSP